MTMTDDGPGLGILARLSIALDGLAAKVDSWERENRRQQRRWTPATPYDYHSITSGIVGVAPGGASTTQLVLNLGAPDDGCMWLVRRVAVYSQSGVTGTLGGNLWGFVIPGYGGQVNTSPLQGPGLFIGPPSTQTMPYVNQWTSRQVPVKANEYVILLITGGTQNQTAYAELTVENYEDRAGRVAFEI